MKSHRKTNWRWWHRRRHTFHCL